MSYLLRALKCYFEKTAALPAGLSEDSLLYSKQVWTYDHFSQKQDWPGRIASFLLPIVHNAKVLDMCCGTGKYASLLGPAATKYVGVDKSSQALGLALRTVNYDLYCADAATFEGSQIYDVGISTWGIGSIDPAKRESSLANLRNRCKNVYLVENHPDGEFQALRGAEYAARAKAYELWLTQQGCEPMTTLHTTFEFDSAQQARQIFAQIWGQFVGNRVVSPRIEQYVRVWRAK